jgi:hypothetical protein
MGLRSARRGRRPRTRSRGFGGRLVVDDQGNADQLPDFGVIERGLQELDPLDQRVSLGLPGMGITEHAGRQHQSTSRQAIAINAM